MSIISRRQKELLLNDVYRMINNINCAFANHAKIAERVSNGDLTFFIDSPKKEFVIKYGNKNIRFSCSDKTIKELNSITFSDNSTISGITDSIGFLPRSTIALSEVWGKQKENELRDHNHDEKYADINHTHSEYATKQKVNELNNTLTNKANSVHSHSISNITDLQTQLNNLQTQINARSLNSHLHNISDVRNLYQELSTINNKINQKSDIGHTHSGLWEREPLKEFIKEETKMKWYEKLFKGIEIVGELAQDGYILALQGQVAAIYQVLAANGLIDTAQSVSGAGSLMLGVASKLDTASSIFESIGNKFSSINGFCEKISKPIQQASNYIKGFQKTFDGAQYFAIADNVPTAMAHHVLNPTASMLPSCSSVFAAASSFAA